MVFDDVHIPVLREEVIHHLNLKKGDIIFDGTLGGAGHTIAIIKAIAPTGKIIGADLNSQAISTATSKLKSAGLLDFVIIIHDNFADVASILNNLNIKQLNGFLLDLGLSSILIERSGRGFSYLKNEKLDMRFSLKSGLTAADILNTYSVKKLKEIFFKYGEERWSSRIAKKIGDYRQDKKIEVTGELVEIINKSMSGSYRRKLRGHPAKKVFQALRIEVNDELENLEKAMSSGIDYLKPGSRMVIISYHSLEDRIVKKNFELFAGKCICPGDLPECRCGAKKRGRLITRKPIRPSQEEISKNPRARSAKMRVFEKQ
jgi:16S rRNA (cytosine1402-N4)-methyltransferase